MTLPMTIEIRVARPDDDASLAALDLASWTSQSGIPSTMERERPPGPAFFNDSNPPEIHLVAEDLTTGTVVGYVRLKPPTPLPENAHVMHVSGIAVHPSARRQGIAAKLLTAAEGYSAEHGAIKLSLRVLGTNSPAIQLYEGLGFEREGILRREFMIDGNYVDDLAMAKQLSG